MSKTKLSLIGLLQALGVVGYCFLIGGFIWFASEYFATPPGFLGVALWLSLLVFSAAVSGSIVFGYPAYLALNQNIKDALNLIVYTLLYILGLIGIIIILLLSCMGS